MNRNRVSPLKILTCFLIYLLIVGCQTSPPEARELFERTVAALTAEDHYRYSGDISIEVNEVKIESLAEFEGFVTDHERVYMNLTLQTGAGDTERFTLFSNDENVYIQQQDQWNPLKSGEEAYIVQQFRHWNPVDNFRELITMEKSIDYPASSVQTASATSKVTIHIKPEEMKKIISKELRDQFEASMGRMEDLDRMKQSLKLSEQEFQQMKQQVEESVKQSQMELDWLIQSLNVNAVYNIEVNPNTWYPESLKMSVQSNYESSNGPVEENTVVNYRFTDFGQKPNVSLPR